MFVKEIYRFRGFPKVLVSDTDPIFIGIFLERVMEDEEKNINHEFNISFTNKWFVGSRPNQKERLFWEERHARGK
jgi:hypothetical protein